MMMMINQQSKLFIIFSHSWIWILVGVLGCVVVLLAIFCVFLYYRNKKNKKSLMLIE